MTTSKTNSKPWILALLLFPMIVVAQQEPEKFSYTGWAQLGVENSSNVNLEEIEDASGSSDTAAVLDAGLDLTTRITERTRLAGGYSFFGQRYSEFDSFDLDMHLLYADLSHEIGAATLGANYYYANASLSGDDFLSYLRPSLYLGYLVSENLYLRASLEQAEKNFDPFPERDAEAGILNLDGYWYLAGRESYISVGLSGTEEDATESRYSWEGGSLRLRYSNRFSLADRDARLQLGLRWDDRDYRGVTPAIGEARDDRRRTANAELEFWLNPSLSLIGKLEQNAYESNLPSADYDEVRTSLAAKFSF